jgi:hypothetical protein
VTSQNRHAAGRANGRTGKGRKSAAGKAASGQNAYRHGLSLPLLADPAASAEVAALADAIAPRAETGELAELARRIAEAQFDLVRVRRARHDLIAGALASPDGIPDGPSSRIAGKRERLLQRAEKIATQKGPWASLLGQVVAQLRSAGSGPDKLARILGDLAPQLAAMDRHERWARARRMRAIQAYDNGRMCLKTLHNLELRTYKTKVTPDSHRREDGC